MKSKRILILIFPVLLFNNVISIQNQSQIYPDKCNLILWNHEKICGFMIGFYNLHFIFYNTNGKF